MESDMKTKKKKILKIILIVVISLVVLATLIGTIGLRLVIRHYAKQVTAEMTPPAEYFTEYDQTLADFGEMQDITHNGMTVTIPAYFQELEMPMHETYMYGVIDEEGNSSDTECIILSRPDDVSDLSLFSEESMAEMGDSFLKKYALKKLAKGFEDLGHGIPDNAYTTLKSTSLLSKDDYSFWNWQQGFAYVVSGLLKNAYFTFDYNYIYETDDICGIIHVRDYTLDTDGSTKGYKYYIIAEMYSTDDFSTSRVLLIRSNSLEMAYGMINSIVIE